MQTRTRLVSIADLEQAIDERRTVHATDGRLGTAHTLYYDRLDGRPRWLAVSDPDGRLLVLPATELRDHPDGLSAPFTSGHVAAAPPAAGSEIDPDTERRLAEHYRLDDVRGTADQPLHRDGWDDVPRPAAYGPAVPAARHDERTGPSARRRDDRRPFWLTSEFVLLVLGVAAMFVASATDPDELPHQRCWVIASIMGAAYILSRGIAKAGRRSREADPRDEFDLDGRRHPGRRGAPGSDTRPFWETSELLVLIVGIVAMFLTTIADPVSLTHERAWMCFTILGGSYVLSRGLAKSASGDLEH